MKFGLILIILIHSVTAYSFIRSRSIFGDTLKWKGSSNNIILRVNSTNNDGIGDDDLDGTHDFLEIVDQSIGEWNGNADITLLRQNNSSGPETNQNDIYFDPASVFGSSVLAVTSIRFIEATGEIVETDIIINDTVSFSSDPADTDNASFFGPFFIGDVITHELGHVVGLGHSQNHYATMNFTVFKGQFTISQDDIQGLKRHYPLTTLGEIHGQIAGTNLATDPNGNLIVGVFGARVMAISAETGEVVQEVISSPSGGFSIKNLSLNDTYFLYVAPFFENAGAPSYFDTVRKDFCQATPNSAASNYRGSFFQGCGNSSNGLPLGIELTNFNQVQNIGIVNINCDLKTASLGTNGDGREIVPVVEADNTLGNAVVGFIDPNDVVFNDGVGDDSILILPGTRKAYKYEIDLSSFDPVAAGYGAKDLYLDIKIVGQGLHSSTRLNVEATRVDSGRVGFSAYNDVFPDTDFDVVTNVTEKDFNGNDINTGIDLDIIARIPLEEAFPEDNIYEIDLIPQSITRGTTNISTDYFPSVGTFLDDYSFYLMVVSVSEKIGTEYFVLDYKTYTPFDDNESCLEAPNTLGVSASSTSKDSIQREDIESSNVEQSISDSLSDTVGAGCGTINTNGPGSGGGNGMAMLIFAVLLWLAQRQKMLKFAAKR